MRARVAGHPDPMVRREWTATAAPLEVRRLRHAVCDFALAAGMPAARSDDVALAVTEVVTNAIMHGLRHSGGEGVVRVAAEVSDGDVTVWVEDDGVGLVRRDDSPGAGYGLILTSQVAEELTFAEPPAGGTEVRMTFAAAA